MKSPAKRLGLSVLLLSLAASVFTAAIAQRAQQEPASVTAPGSPAIDKLPPELREPAGQIMAAQGPARLGTVKKFLRAGGSANPKARPFLLWLLENEPEPSVRIKLLQVFAHAGDPDADKLLRRTVVKDNDPSVIIAASHSLRDLSTAEPMKQLEKRIEAARLAGDRSLMKSLARAHEDMLLQKSASFPGFLRTPPPVFAAHPSGRPVRVLAFGNFGNGSAKQKRLAAAMVKFDRRSPLDFAMILGDNFLHDGLFDPADPRWKTDWEDLYSPMKIPAYAILGNHDWFHPDSPAAEILYSAKSKTWKLVAPYYTFTAGHAQFFALETMNLSPAQLIWLEEELGKSQARWKIVFGHNPIYSYGKHGNNAGLVAKLLPVIRDADLYVAGHEDDVQHLRTDGRLELLVSGGGTNSPKAARSGPRTIWASPSTSLGFTVLDIEKERLRLRVIDEEQKTLYDYSLTARSPSKTAAALPLPGKAIADVKAMP